MLKILDKHNTLRNQVAGGNVTHLDPAVRMSTMRWDHDLALFALFNAIRCKFQHDNCHRTTRFSSPGQNLALDIWLDAKLDVWVIIEKQIQRWFSENVVASKDDMKSLGANWYVFIFEISNLSSYIKILLILIGAILAILLK